MSNMMRYSPSIILAMCLAAAACGDSGEDAAASGSGGAGAATTTTTTTAAGGDGGAGGGAGGFTPSTSSTMSGGGGMDDCLDSVTLRVRDFSHAHPDFQWGAHPNFGQITGVRTGIVADQLDGNQKPVYIAGSDVSPNGPTFAPFTGATNFDMWFRDTPGQNHAIDVELMLQEEGTSLVYDDADFHPIDENFGFGDEGYQLNGMPNNWHFTTEAAVSFRYAGGEEFTFRGDDDIWVFINDRLAIDLGGLHGPIEASVALDDQAAALSLSVGEVYSLRVFHAERNHSGSNYRLETSDFCLLPPEIN